MKRLLDIIISLCLLSLLWPLMLLVAFLIMSLMGRPIFFIQTRPGLNATPFSMIKFRSMADGDGDDAARLTRLGRFLRASSLDELPGLWNVFIGQMSLVGPRPLLMEYLDHYSVEQARRHEVRPGLTGWAQVNGRNALDWETRLGMDVWYVDHHSLFLDIKILFLTVLRVFQRHGVSHKGHVTMPRFDEHAPVGAGEASLQPQAGRSGRPRGAGEGSEPSVSDKDSEHVTMPRFDEHAPVGAGEASLQPQAGRSGRPRGAGEGSEPSVSDKDSEHVTMPRFDEHALVGAGEASLQPQAGRSGRPRGAGEGSEPSVSDKNSTRENRS